MPRISTLPLRAAACLLALAAVAGVRAEPAAAAVPEGRWHDSFEAFAAADRAHAPAPGGVVFVGSSSIRLWSDLEQQFEATPAIVKRGFGGSRMSDCAKYADRLVLPYKPRMVVVYAGDNDLAEGRSPNEVLGSFTRFVESVHAALPQTRIAFVSIKPSPLRQSLLPAMRETNALIAAYTRTQPNLDYIDVFSKMLDGEGRPRGELFRADSLHMNAAGYGLWKTVISSHLR